MNQRPSGPAVAEQLKRAGVEYLCCLPDRTTSAIVQAAHVDPSLRIIHVCQEAEGISLCCALSYGEKRAALVMGHAGLLNSVNSLMTVSTDLRRPLLMLIGLLDKEEGLRPTESRIPGIRATEPILDTLHIPYLLVERRGDEESVASLIEGAYSALRPLAILFGTEVAR